MVQRYDQPEIDLAGFVIKGLVEWEEDDWRCRVTPPEGDFIMLDGFSTWIIVKATSKESAIDKIKYLIARYVIILNAETLYTTETAIRRGLAEDIVL